MTDVLGRLEGHVGVAEINRPPNNFFDRALIAAIADTFDRFVAAGARSILLCAAGRNFCAGANLGRPAEDEGTTPDEAQTRLLYLEAIRLFRCPLPIVAAVNGSAVGGGAGLALVADFRVATAESRFSINFSRLGFHPGFGLSVTLPRLVGPQQAALLLYTGRRVTGTEAAAIGLVDVLAPSDGLRATAAALATEIAQSAPIAVQSTRATLLGGLADAVAEAVTHELAEQSKHFATADFKEGVQAAAERRLPVFSGS